VATTRGVLATPLASINDIIATLWHDASRNTEGTHRIAAVAHRVVYGGPLLRTPTWVTDQVRATIAQAHDDAPEHTVFELEGMDAATRVFGAQMPQVAIFDTAFHRTLRPAAYAYAGPHAWLTSGLRRYGFHGISHQYASRRAAHLLRDMPTDIRIVTAHLGGGCSLAAIHNGKSVDTTMGFTPMDGLPMATRSGAVDPGLLLHLLRGGTYTVDSLQHVLNEESGLKGLSGVSGDMRAVLSAADNGDDQAQLAIDVYTHRLRQGIAAMAASMNGIDALVFTAGVGEYASRIRIDVCAGITFLGVTLDDAANRASSSSDRIISAPSSRVAVLVIHAEENWSIAQQALELVNTHNVGGPCHPVDAALPVTSSP
jgi:acetate kinase